MPTVSGTQLGDAIDDAQKKAEIDLRWTTHLREHASSDKETDRRIDEIKQAIDKAFVAQQTALRAALDDHHREHVVHDTAHEREHEATDQALSKAETATDKRFAGVNEFREQLREQAQRLASTDRVDALSKGMADGFGAITADINRRFEEARAQIIELQKVNVAANGKETGKTGTYAAIVAAVSFSATAIGLIIVIANLVAK